MHIQKNLRFRKGSTWNFVLLLSLLLLLVGWFVGFGGWFIKKQQPGSTLLLCKLQHWKSEVLILWKSVNAPLSKSGWDNYASRLILSVPRGSDQVITFTLTVTWPVIFGPARMNTIDTAHKYPYLLQNLSRAGGRVGWGGCVVAGDGGGLTGRRGWGCIHL